MEKDSWSIMERYEWRTGKVKKIEELLAELNKHILEILGTDNGNWYLSYKMLIYGALDNMGKYGATYNEGYLIAQIESNYSRQRKQIWNDRPKTDMTNYKKSKLMN